MNGPHIRLLRRQFVFKVAVILVLLSGLGILVERGIDKVREASERAQ
jgi:hypothetical protein